MYIYIHWFYDMYILFIYHLTVTDNLVTENHWIQAACIYSYWDREREETDSLTNHFKDHSLTKVSWFMAGLWVMLLTYCWWFRNPANHLECIDLVNSGINYRSLNWFSRRILAINRINKANGLAPQISFHGADNRSHFLFHLVKTDR